MALVWALTSVDPHMSVQFSWVLKWSVTNRALIWSFLTIIPVFFFVCFIVFCKFSRNWKAFSANITSERNFWIWVDMGIHVRVKTRGIRKFPFTKFTNEFILSWNLFHWRCWQASCSQQTERKQNINNYFQLGTESLYKKIYNSPLFIFVVLTCVESWWAVV